MPLWNSHTRTATGRVSKVGTVGTISKTHGHRSLGNCQIKTLLTQSVHAEAGAPGKMGKAFNFSLPLDSRKGSASRGEWNTRRVCVCRFKSEIVRMISISPLETRQMSAVEGDKVTPTDG
jgi:hypothetical protein